MVVGGDSTIGNALATSYANDGVDMWKTTRRSTHVSERCLFLDLQKDVADCPLPSHPISVVFLCAAMTSMEQCRLYPEISRQVNVVNTVALAKRLIDAGAFVVFLSSSAVFDGEAPYAKPTDPVNPKTEYGQQKAEAEEQLLRLGYRVAIVRFGKIISPGMPLFYGWFRNLQAGKAIHPFSDMVMAPISLNYAVDVLQRVAGRQVPGIIHATATKDVTYADIAQFIAQKMRVIMNLVEPISYRDAGIAFSPQHTTLNCKTLEAINFHPPIPMEAFNQWLQETSLLPASRSSWRDKAGGADHP